MGHEKGLSPLEPRAEAATAVNSGGLAGNRVDSLASRPLNSLQQNKVSMTLVARTPNLKPMTDDSE